MALTTPLRTQMIRETSPSMPRPHPAVREASLRMLMPRRHHAPEPVPTTPVLSCGAHAGIEIADFQVSSRVRRIEIAE
jgi:hypothetical protein